MNDRGSALIAWLIVLVIFGGIVLACLSLAPDVEPYIERVEQSIGGAFGGVL
jgi:hypothetical protein